MGGLVDDIVDLIEAGEALEDGSVLARNNLAATSMATKLDLTYVLRLLLVAHKQQVRM